jgi:hypothetical protein
MICIKSQNEQVKSQFNLEANAKLILPFPSLSHSNQRCINLANYSSMEKNYLKNIFSITNTIFAAKFLLRSCSTSEMKCFFEAIVFAQYNHRRLYK